MEQVNIPYRDFLALAIKSEEPLANFLRRELLRPWRDAYSAMSVRPTDIIVFTYGTFDYLFDAHQDSEPYDLGSGISPVEARLVAAIGTSALRRLERDDGRLRGITMSSMPSVDGTWDRGHFIGHAIGGTVDGNEANVFLQLRKTNRGKYRNMERYCIDHPGVLCFSRPLYTDASAHPAEVEFGVLRPENDWWIETLPNRPSASAHSD